MLHQLALIHTLLNSRMTVNGGIEWIHKLVVAVDFKVQFDYLWEKLWKCLVRIASLQTRIETPDLLNMGWNCSVWIVYLLIPYISTHLHIGMEAQQIECPAHPSACRIMTLWGNKGTHVKSKHWASETGSGRPAMNWSVWRLEAGTHVFVKRLHNHACMPVMLIHCLELLGSSIRLDSNRTTDLNLKQAFRILMRRFIKHLMQFVHVNIHNIRPRTAVTCRLPDPSRSRQLSSGVMYRVVW